MSRPLRIEFAGALYHVTARGNARQDIYFTDADRHKFLRILGDVADRKGWVIHAYCLMTNHYHLIVETRVPNLGRGMQCLNGRYGKWFNRAYDRVGHVFQGRYGAILVERDEYLQQLARYVVLNPVRAGIVSEPGDWEWSSYRATVGDAPAPRWLATTWLLGQFGSTTETAVAAYRRFVDGGRDQEPIWTQRRNELYLGSGRFIERIQAESDDGVKGVPLAQLRPVAKPIAWYAETYPNRYEAMAEAFRSGWFSKKSIAAYFGVHYKTVTRAVRRADNTHRLAE